MKKRLLLPALLSLLLPAALFAQPTVDGIINDPSYVVIATYTGTNDGFGTSNDLGALHLYSDGTDLYLGITGELENNGNQFAIFLDFSGYGGAPAGTALPVGSGYPGNLAGTILASELDFLLHANRGNGSTPNSLYIDAVRYGTTSILGTGYVGEVNLTGSSTYVSTGAALGTIFGGEGTANMTTAFRGDFATTPDAGWEMRIPLAAFPGVDATMTLRVLVAVTSGSGYWSNEFLPSTTLGGTADGSGNFGFAPNLSSISFTTGNGLPVRWLSLEAAWLNSRVQLRWETADEVNHSHFEVERSADALAWASLGRVDTHSNPYRYDDIAPLDGRSFYRLRQVDLDGQHTYSPVLEVSGQSLLRFWPNPFTTHLHLTLAAPATSLTLLDMQGRTVWTRAFDAQVQTLSLDLSELPAGAYLGLLRSAGGTRHLRLHKQ
ncbi:MAG: hypothetical protein OHK0039_05980 [Bacteroidia bacterium]